MKVIRSSLHAYQVPQNHCQLNETVGGLDEVDHHRNREVAVDHVGVDQVKVILKLNRVSYFQVLESTFLNVSCDKRNPHTC